MGLTNSFGKHNGYLNFIGDIDDIYIDPDSISGGIGTYEHPYNSFTGFTLTNNKVYRLKKNSSLTGVTALYLNSLTGVTLSTYGNGERPKFICTQSLSQGYAIRLNNCLNCIISNWDITSSQIVMGMVRIDNGKNNSIINCNIHDCLSDGTTNGSGIGIRAGGYNLKILNNEISYVGMDGMYIARTTNLEIGHCYLHHINMNYIIDTGQTYSSGDGIQLDGEWVNYYIHHCIIDRSYINSGNKFNIIISSLNGTNVNSSGITEYCTFKMSPNVVGGIYISNGNGNIIRYNKFEGYTWGVRISGAVDGSGTIQNNTIQNTLIHNNLFYDSTYGVVISNQTTGGTAVTDTRNTKIYNNVFYKCGTHILIQNGYVDSRNNIHLRNGDSGKAMDNIVAGSSCDQYNNCYNDINLISNRGSGITSMVSNPLCVNMNNYDFRLQTNSPCINSGINVNINYDYDMTIIPQGSEPDIGAFEKYI